MANTPNLSLIELEEDQYNAEVTVNNNLKLLDTLIQLSIIDTALTVPPGSPSNGDRYIPAATATGVWAGYENYIAYYFNGWEFIAPEIGWHFVDPSDGFFKYWNGTSWVPFTATAGDVTGPVSSVDNTIVRMDSTTGKVIQNSSVVIDDNNALYGHYAKVSTKTSSYEIISSDAGSVIVCNSASAITITLDEGITTIGFQVLIVNRGTGTVTVAKEGSDTIESKNNSVNLVQFSAASALRLTSTVWSLFGDLE